MHAGDLGANPMSVSSSLFLRNLERYEPGESKKNKLPAEVSQLRGSGPPGRPRSAERPQACPSPLTPGATGSHRAWVGHCSTSVCVTSVNVSTGTSVRAGSLRVSAQVRAVLCETRSAFHGLSLVGLVRKSIPEEGQRAWSQLQQEMMNLGEFSR